MDLQVPGKFEILPDQHQFKLQTVYQAIVYVFRKDANRKRKIYNRFAVSSIKTR